MAYQFIHVEAYSREVSKQKSKGKGGLSVRQVIAEAGREPGNCPHVQEPQAPEILFGSLEQAEAEATSWAEQATDQQGRKLRKDGHCLLAGVVSLPRLEKENWLEFSKRSTEYLNAKYGDRLKCVVAHQDEEHPHIHFYAVPKNGERFEVIHEGQKAAKQAKAESKLKGEQNAAYIAAMRGLQDDFQRKVGQPLGLTRLGPGRRRLTRKAWQAEQAQAKALANVERTAKTRKEQYKAQGLAQGKAQAEAEAQAFGSKVGAVLDGLKGSWHKPSKQAKEQANAVKKEAQSYADKVKNEAEKAVQSERRQRRTAERELEKQKNIATNTEADNKRLTAQLEATEADRQRLLKQLKAGGGGSKGGTRPP